LRLKRLGEERLRELSIKKAGEERLRIKREAEREAKLRELERIEEKRMKRS